MDKHPFAQYVRILGRGKKGSRSLNFDEAEHAMSMILSAQVEPIQLGAFLMLLRVKEESPEELAGFVSAVRKSLPPCPEALKIDLDWSSYAGKRQQQPWFLLAIMALADAGVRVLIHGSAGHTAGRLYSETALAQLGFGTSNNWQQVSTAIEQNGFAYYPLAALCPALESILHLKAVLGLRSPANSLARLLNPASAKYSLHSVFHPRYSEIHQQTLALLGQSDSAIFKGDSGEIERKPDATLKVLAIAQGAPCEQLWPRLMEGRSEKLDTLDAQVLAAFWRGQQADEYGELAVTGTLAVALKLLGRADNQDEAMQLAQETWSARNRSRL